MGCKMHPNYTQLCRFPGAKSSRKSFGMYGGDDGARTRDLCRDSTEASSNLLKLSVTDGFFWRFEVPLVTVIGPLLDLRPLSCKPLPLAAAEPERIFNCAGSRLRHNGFLLGFYGWTVMIAGRLNRKVAPRSEAPSVHKRPPCDSMMDRLMRSPIPVPWGLVVKNGSKTCSAK